MKCVVPNCRNAFVGRAKRDSEQQQPIGFFSFPKCPETFKLWAAFCGYENAPKIKNPYICIEHFKQEDIEGSLKFEMGLAKKRTLRPGAVPCIKNVNKSASERAHLEGIQRRENKRLVDELLAEDETKGFIAGDVEPTPPQEEDDLFEDAFPDYDPLIHEAKIRCRICYQDLINDSSAKDLFDEANSILLFHIEVISGVWISQLEGEPHIICQTCQSSLHNAIEFREMCVNTELRISQAVPEIEVTAIASEDVEEESIPPEPDLITSLDDQVNDQQEPLSPEVTAEPPLKGKPKEEPTESASQDPLSVNLGSRIFKELIDQYTGQEKTRNRTKTGDPSQKTTKPPTKPRKTLVREPKPRRRANPKTKEERNLIRRAQLRAKPPNFVCDQCGQAFRMAHNLRIHQLRHTRTKNFQCPECPMAFYDAYMRNIHVRVRHRGETPYSCRHCTETFAYAGARQKHESEVHGAPPRMIVQRINPKPMPRNDARHYCQFCHKSYASQYSLRWHLKTHTDGLIYKCGRCEKSFNDPAKLKRHEMSHEKRPLQCDVCLKGFYQRTRLKEHELIHTGERPYWCEICNVNFRYKYNMKTHANTKMHQDNLHKKKSISELVVE
ncbi:zinc finger protein 2 isoform X1 [Drosophila bipectinata]|uniref:zinc finger protein 2 isoform X1 n=2 Tax=Drosophila bipectinata TaxID=42026 RepID=UPI001C8A7F68|nr:zinc finger protein 184 [Drosophila bipectinata]